jgi:hypothetical protein
MPLEPMTRGEVEHPAEWENGHVELLTYLVKFLDKRTALF